MNVLLGISGSVSAILTSKLIDAINAEGHNVKIVITNASKNFLKLPHFNDSRVYCDADEWNDYHMDGDVTHIKLTSWADAFLIAPASANTIAKISNGICDNLLTCCARAWPFPDYNVNYVEMASMYIAPAMNSHMYAHPITQTHTDRLKSWGVKIIPPQEKALFCGDVGNGALAQIDDIIKALK